MRIRRRGIFTAVFLLLAAVIVLIGTLQLRKTIDQRKLAIYAQEVPAFVEDLKIEFSTQKNVYEKIALVSGEMGVQFYQSEMRPSDTDELTWVMDKCQAESVSLLDAGGKVQKTTGPKISEEALSAELSSLKVRVPSFAVYSSDNGSEGENDGCILVKIPLPGTEGQSLLFEFSCRPLVQVYDQLSAWPELVLDKFYVQEGLHVFAIEDGSELSCYPKNSYGEAERNQLFDELTAAVENEKDRGKLRFQRILGKSYMALSHRDSEGKLDLVLAITLRDFIAESLFVAAILMGLMAVNLVIFQIYARRCTRADRPEKNRSAFIRRVRGRTLPGLLMMMALLLGFIVLFLMLGNLTNVSRYAMQRRGILQQKIVWREEQKEEICGAYTELYRKQTMAVAEFLKEPAYKTREGLKKLSDLSGAEYLMLFDKAGKERISSNSYTGFSVTGEKANLSEELQAMVLGYPSVVVGPEKDPYSGKLQISAAVLLTTDDGQADGFLLAVFDTGELQEILDSESIQNTVSSFVIMETDTAAVVGKKDGLFIAHTDPDMIGQDAREYLDESVLSKGFEGFTDYNEKSVCISSSLEEGVNVMMIVSDHADRGVVWICGCLTVLLLLLCFFEYLFIHRVCEEETAAEKESGSGESVMIFLRGYAFFFAVLAFTDTILYLAGEKNYFAFIFEEKWSRGLHLFALWAVIFAVAIAVSILRIVSNILNRVANSFGPQGRTIIKVIDNVLYYLVVIGLVFVVLHMFGMSTVMLVAAFSSVAVAFSFGARNVTGDFLIGAFIILENSVHVGDEIRYNDRIWTVTNISLRTTEITDEDQNVMRINSSEINRIVNLSRGKKKE